MSKPGARDPSGRGAPNQQEPRPAMDRTASLPNLGAAAAETPPPERSRQHHQTPRGSQGRQSTTDSPASPTSPTARYCTTTKCRPIPTDKNPIPAGHTSTARTPENSFSKISPSTHTKIASTEKYTSASQTRQTTQQPRKTPTSSNVARPNSSANNKKHMNPPTRNEAPYQSVPTRSSPREPLGPQSVPKKDMAKTPALQSMHSTSQKSLTSSETAAARPVNRDPRTNRDTRRQMAPLVMPSKQNPESPAPPRTSAYDSPAMRSGQSSLSGSSTSLASYGRRAESEVGNTATPISPTPSMEIDFDFQTGGRAPRRRRSPDEETEEEAKRYRFDTQSPQAHAQRVTKSPTFAEALRNPPSPQNPTTGNQTGQKISPGAGTTQIPAQNTNTPPVLATTENNATTAAKKQKRPRYPPLVVDKLPNWATHFKALAATLGRPPNARPFRQGVRFSPESEEEYRVVQRYLTTLEKESGISWFAYSLPADKKLKVAIRGLPADTPPQDIEDELRTLGYEPEYVRHINARQGRPGCVFHAVLTKTENVRAIYDTTTFMYMNGVKIEAWRGKRGPAQCHRCQQFRHSSHQCHRPLACVRCGEGHTARDCPRPREEPATCKNCGGAHPANNIKCPVFQKETQHRRAGTVAITTTTIPRQTPKEIQTDQQPMEKTLGKSLMAAANEPTQRGEAASSQGRRRKKRGGKGKQKIPPTTEIQENTQTASANNLEQNIKNDTNKQTTKTQHTALQQSVKTATHHVMSTKAGEKQRARPLPAETQTENSTTEAAKGWTSSDREAAQNWSTKKHNKDFTACAIKLLMDLIKAIRQGKDVEQVILDGLAELLTLYHNV